MSLNLQKIRFRIQELQTWGRPKLFTKRFRRNIGPRQYFSILQVLPETGISPLKTKFTLPCTMGSGSRSWALQNLLISPRHQFLSLFLFSRELRTSWRFDYWAKNICWTTIFLTLIGDTSISSMINSKSSLKVSHNLHTDKGLTMGFKPGKAKSCSLMPAGVVSSEQGRCCFVKRWKDISSKHWTD